MRKREILNILEEEMDNNKSYAFEYSYSFHHWFIKEK